LHHDAQEKDRSAFTRLTRTLLLIFTSGRPPRDDNKLLQKEAESCGTARAGIGLPWLGYDFSPTERALRMFLLRPAYFPHSGFWARIEFDNSS
jgi:hypothetical protein